MRRLPGHSAERHLVERMETISIEELRSTVGAVLEPVDEVAAAYAYGSRVRGRPLPLSDLDIGFVLEADARREDPLLAERLAARIATALGTGIEIDAHIADDLPLSVRGRMVTEGLLIYERDASRRVEFETDTRRLYFDFLPLLERDAREGLRARG